ncbi:LuxR family transcriptional regulator [cyanobacterium TDX16]|nr:LuxR family transcriptional regulator [cyanobacterium TDX16]
MESPSIESNTLLALSNNLADAVERAGRAVVAVNARHRIPSTGVHWRNGIIVTAEHTVRRDEEIAVRLPDDRTVAATLIGRDSSTDLAVLKIPETQLPTAEIGDTSTLQVGNLVLAVARPSENGLSASWGVVSAKGVGVTQRDWCGKQTEGLLKLDLSLYPGFSGSPLVDAKGSVVGINTVGPRNMVLAIPVTTVNRVIDTLLEKGKIARGYLGLGMQPVLLPDNLKNALNLFSNGGVIVVNIESDGPADRAGVLIGDVLISLDGRSIADTGDVQAMLGSESVGKTLNAQVIRGGTLLTVPIAIGER